LPDDVLELLVTTFHEVRSGRTLDGVKLERGGAVMSTAEAVSVGLDASLHAAFFGRGTVTPELIVIHLAGTVIKDDPKDADALRSYWDLAVKPRAKKELGQWKAFHRARKHLGLTGS
jgi:hypothetical protein